MTGAGPFECVIFDCDSTLTKVEGIDLLAGEKKEEIAALTRSAMEGKSSFHEIYRQRLALLSPSFSSVNRIGQAYIDAVTTGAKETVSALHFLKKRVFVISGGFRMPLSIFARFLGISGERVFGVDLFFDDKGNYRGFDEENCLTHNRGKTEVVRDLAGRGKKAVFIGDGATDLEAGEAVELFVGFGGVVARSEIEKKAAHYVKTPELSGILPIVLTPFERSKLLADSRFKNLLQEEK